MTIAPHLSVEELQASYRQTKTPTRAHHYQIIWLLACGKTTAEVMAVTGYSRGGIYELVWGYNHLGPESLGVQRRPNRDRHPLLNHVEQAIVVANLSRFCQPFSSGAEKKSSFSSGWSRMAFE